MARNYGSGCTSKEIRSGLAARNKKDTTTRITVDGVMYEHHNDALIFRHEATSKVRIKKAEWLAVKAQHDEQAEIDAQLADHENQLAAIAETEALNEGETESTFEELPLTFEEELGAGKQRREDPQGEAGMLPSDVPEDFIYRAELSDPDIADRMEVFRAESDFEAVKQAYDYCIEGVQLLELHQLDEDYNEVRHIDLEASKPRLTIIMPMDGFTPERLDNLCRMVTAKEALLKAALGVEQLPIRVTEQGVEFPWFWSEDFINDAEREAYTTLIQLICETAKEKKRVVAKSAELPENAKFAFRCWLISIGMVGGEYKAARKILLSKLEGCSAWKGGPPQKATEAQAETTEA